MKLLIVNADDFGLLPNVSRAIVDAYQAGSVTSTTLMVNMPSVGHAVSLAHANPGLGVGLHCTLTCYRPISDPQSVPTLVDSQGCFVRRGELLRRSLFGRLNQAEIDREVRAQFRRFDELGLPITHVDSHQHVHMVPAIFRAVAAVAEERRLPLRIPVVADLSRRFHLGRQYLKKSVLQFLATRHKRSLRSSKTNDFFLSIWDVVPFPEPIGQGDYHQLLRRVPQGVTELMVHPAYFSEELREFSDIVEVSRQETKILLQAPLLEVARRQDMHVGTYANL